MLPCSKEAGVYRVALSEANRNQDPAFCQESSQRIKLIMTKKRHLALSRSLNQ
jgi:hypothetical protein